MKKRIASLVLVFCLFAGTAMADTLTLQGDLSKTSPIRLWDPVLGYETVTTPWLFALEHQVPDITVKLTDKADVSESTLVSKGINADAALLKGPYHWADLWQSGHFADLTDTTAVAEIVEVTYPLIAESVIFEGRAYAVPVSISTHHTLVWSEEGWDMAGLTFADVPVSFSGLLDFLECWAALPENDRVSTFSGITKKQFSSSTYALILVKLLIQHYALQCKVQGIAVDYTRSDFITMLDRCYSVGAALYKHDKEPKEFALFEISSGDARALPRAVKLGLTENDQPVVAVTMNVVVLRADTQSLELAKTFLDCYCDQIIHRPGNDYTPFNFSQWEHEADVAHAQLFPNADQPVMCDTPFSYPAALEMISELQALLDEEDLLDKQQAEIEPWIDTAQQAWEVLGTRHWYYSREELAAYKTVAPAFCPEPVPDADNKEIEKALTRWAEGRDTALALGANLNSILSK